MLACRTPGRKDLRRKDTTSERARIQRGEWRERRKAEKEGKEEEEEQNDEGTDTKAKTKREPREGARIHKVEGRIPSVCERVVLCVCCVKAGQNEMPCSAHSLRMRMDSLISTNTREGQWQGALEKGRAMRATRMCSSQMQAAYPFPLDIHPRSTLGTPRSSSTLTRLDILAKRSQ